MTNPDSSAAPSRREQIAQAVIDLASSGGSRSVTHSAIDRRLNLAKGSTSYYCRTRGDLIASGADLMRANSNRAYRDLAASEGSLLVANVEATSAGFDALNQTGVVEVPADSTGLLGVADLNSPAKPSGRSTPTSPTLISSTRVSVDYVRHLIEHRSAEVRARLALAPELPDGTLRDLFFSGSAATELFGALGADDPARAAAGFIDLLEGILMRATSGAQTVATEDIAVAVSTYLRGAARD